MNLMVLELEITVVSPIMVKTTFFDHPSFEKMPKYSPTSLNSKTVAKAIVQASNSSRLEIIYTFNNSYCSMAKTHISLFY